MVYGSAATWTLAAAQLVWLLDVTEAAVTEVKWAVKALLFVSVNLTVPAFPGKRSAGDAEAVIVTLIGLPVVAPPDPPPADRKYAKAAPPAKLTARNAANAITHRLRVTGRERLQRSSGGR